MKWENLTEAERAERDETLRTGRGILIGTSLAIGVWAFLYLFAELVTWLAQ